MGAADLPFGLPLAGAVWVSAGSGPGPARAVAVPVAVPANESGSGRSWENSSSG